MAQTKNIEERLQQLLALADMRISGELDRMNRIADESDIGAVQEAIEKEAMAHPEKYTSDSPEDTMMRETRERLINAEIDQMTADLAKDAKDAEAPRAHTSNSPLDKMMLEVEARLRENGEIPYEKRDEAPFDRMMRETEQRLGQDVNVPAKGNNKAMYDDMMSEAFDKVKGVTKEQKKAIPEQKIRESDEKRRESEKAQMPDVYGKQPLAAISPKEPSRASRGVNAFAAVVEARRNEKGIQGRVDAGKMVQGISNDNVSGPKKVLFEWQESYRKEAERASKGGKRSSGQLVEYDATKRLLDQGYKGTEVLNAFRSNGRDIPPAVYACVKDHKQEERREGIQVASNMNSFDR